MNLRMLLHELAVIAVEIGEDSSAFEDKYREIESALQEATRWIPVGERLPKEPDEHHCTRCFVFYENPDGRKYSAEGSYIGDGRFDVTGRWKVTHWMPLPVPPEGGTK
jgi:hypothetical protein